MRPPFWPRHIEGRRVRITQIFDDILDTLGDEIDVMTELAVPVSVAVSGELVGIDPADRSNLADLVQASVAGLEGLRVGPARRYSARPRGRTR
jgi:cytochrome P450